MKRDYTVRGPTGFHPEIQVFHRGDLGADVQVLHSGFHICPAGHGWRGRRNHALIHHVLQGQGRVRFGKREWRLGAGDSFLFYPHDDLWYEADRSDPWRYLWLGLGGTRISHYLDLCGFRREEPVHPAQKDRPVGHFFQEILEIIESEDLAQETKVLRVQARLFSLLETLAVERERGSVAGGAPKEIPYVQELITFLEQAYSRPLTTTTIARFAGLERTYCCHLFSSTTGRPLMQYLSDLRMHKALELLRTTNLSVRAIAESVGYTDAGVFSKRFRRALGLSPSQARGETLRVF